MLLLLFIILQASAGEITIQPQEFQAAVEKCFAAQPLGREGVKRILEFRTLPRPVTVPGADYRLSVDEALLPEVRGNMSIAVSVSVGGSVTKRVLVPVKVRTYGMVGVAARQIEQHAELQQGDILFQERETTSAPEDVVCAASQLDGRRTKKIITAGSLLRQEALERMPSVQQNQNVILLVRAGAVRLSAKATAKADGVIGQMIQVQRDGSHDRLFARVVADGMVEVVSERIVR